MILACPKCSSDNTQKLSLAVEGGTFSNSGVTVGVGAARGGAGLMAASTKGSSTSKLAQKHEAPEKVPVIRGGLSIIVIGWIVSLFAGSWASAVGCLIAAMLAVLGWKYNFKDFPRELAEWNAKYLCLRCSEVFTPAEHMSDRTAPEAEAAA